jgi:hypothetical protein
MSGIKELSHLLSEMRPVLNTGRYVFTKVDASFQINFVDIIASFKEEENTTLVLNKEKADTLQLPYEGIFSWITLTVHSSLEAIGLTAAVSKALTEHKISCNVIAAYYHDHIFIAENDAKKAIEILNNLSLNAN